MARKEIKHRQVIVIGAGPAGAACAQRLAEDGVDVLMIERRSIIGNPAQCGAVSYTHLRAHETR